MFIMKILNSPDAASIPEDKKPDFLLSINFPSGLKDPQRIFATASSLLEALHSCDEMLLTSISTNIQPIFVLEQVETGSIKMWLKQLLETVPDDALNNLDWKPAVGQYLIKGKYLILKKLGVDNGLPDQATLEKISDELHVLAKDTGALKMPAYSKISELDIAKVALRFSKAMSDLKDNESISFDCDAGDANIEAGYSVTEQEIDNLLIDQELTNVSDVILIIRRPDFLGDARWEFSFEKRKLMVAINDREWLAKFQAGEIDIRPGDALKVKLRETVYYGANGDVVKTDKSIEKVIHIIRKQIQASLI